MMDEEKELRTPALSNSVQQQIQQIVKQNSSLSSPHAAELETVLTALAELPFKDEIQRENFLEKVQSLQGYHIIQVFNLGVAPLRKSVAKSSIEFLEDVNKLVDICISFCYTNDVSKRIAFDYYMRAMTFCFPSDTKQCLSTEVVSTLLELVRLCQDGKFGADHEYDSNFRMFGKSNYTSDFFSKLLQGFDSRRNEDYLVEIINRTLRLASADDKHANKLKKDGALRNEHPISSFLATNWMKLLELANVSNSFALALVEVDLSGEKIEPFFAAPIGYPAYNSCPYQSTIFYFLRVLEEMKRNGNNVNIPHDKTRMDIFFNHVDNFCVHPNIATVSLQLLAATSISNEVLREVLDGFFHNKRTEANFMETAFQLVLMVLSLRPDGELLKKIMNFWIAAFSDDPGYANLAFLLGLFEERSSSERETAERILHFLERLPCNLLPLMMVWRNFLRWLIKIFPTTFHLRPEVLALIEKAAAVARQMPVGQHQAHFAHEHAPPFQFLQWICQQKCTVETKSEMIWLLTYCTNSDASSHRWASLLEVKLIISLSLCKQLPFSTKQNTLRELTFLDSSFKEPVKTVLKQIVITIASNQSLEYTEEMLRELLALIKSFAGEEGPRTIPEDLLEALSFLSRAPISGDRRLEVIKSFRNKSEIDFKSSLYILQLMKMQMCVLGEEANEYFDLLFHAVVHTLKGDDVLCEQLLFTQHSDHQFPSTNVLKVWNSAVAGLISLGLYKEQIDLQCCRPVLEQAWGFDSPYEILQLFFVVRSTALRLAHLSRGQIEACSSCSAQISSNGCCTGKSSLLKTFFSAATTILHLDIFSTENKLVLIKKACDIIVSTPHITETLTSALYNLLPYFSGARGNVSSYDEIYLFNRIIATLDNFTLLNQLSRIPRVFKNSFSVAFSGNVSIVSSRVKWLDILLFIASLQDLDQAFFDHLGPFMKVAIRHQSSSLDGVLELLKELQHVLRNVRSELIPLTMLNFAFFIENPVNEQERDRFLSEVAMKFKISPIYRVLTFLEVPRLLWKIYRTTSSAAKRGELIDRVGKIVKSKKGQGYWMIERADSVNLSQFFGVRDQTFIRRRIACCELEWLVLHSNLSTEDAALALDLSSLFFQAQFGQNAICLTFSDLRIEDGFFKFLPYEDEAASEVRGEGTCATSWVKVRSISPVKKAQEAILTPVLMVEKVIHNFKRVIAQEGDLSENVVSFWKLIFEKKEQFRCNKGCKFFVDHFVDVFLSILAEASSIEIIFHWARQNQHHVCQCSKVIVEACKWHRNDIDRETAIKFQTLVSTTMSKMLPSHGSCACFRSIEPSLEHLASFLEKQLQIEVTTRVLELYQVNVQAGVTVGEIVSSWSSIEHSLELVKKIRVYCEAGTIFSLNRPRSDFVCELLKSFACFCMDSCEDVQAKLTKLLELYDQLGDDPYGLSCLPNWRQAMITDGFPARAIDSWCVAFLVTPLKDLKSRDIDAIVYLNSRSLHLVNLDSRSQQVVTPVSEIIKRVIFPDDGFQVTEGEGIKKSEIKERIRLARLLFEFIDILRLLKPEENIKDAVVRKSVIEACHNLCISYENKKEKRNDLYKIHGQKLEFLLTEIFGNHCTCMSEDKDVSSHDRVVTYQEDKEESCDAASVSRQPYCRHEHLPSILRHKEVHEAVLVLLRRWLLGIVTRPALASHTQEIVQLLFSFQPSNDDPALLEKCLVTIQSRILSLERNQSLMAQLQAIGYNRRRQDNPDLWSSPKIELPCYLSKRESPNGSMFTKKLAEVLRSQWNEWKDLLSMYNIDFVKVDDVEVRREDLFGVQASLEEMEEQVAAVKERARQLSSAPFKSDCFNSTEDIDRRVEQLIRLEQQHRRRIEKLYKNSRSTDTCQEMVKFVAVWENRFLEQVKLCSERIPGCYAPNGFHSEKPVICALSVDNRILTVFKEEKGRREEIENVEVKLFEAGLYVYGLHTSGHDYVTDELWAAFYKMLLEKRLVPRIVLSNQSPGFHWIKNFVNPVTRHPFPRKWDLHTGIVPEQEDYFDYLPLYAALWRSVRGLDEFLTLTAENVSGFQFNDLKDISIVEEKEKRTKHMAGKAIQQLKHELQLLHGDNEPIRRALAGKLAFAVKETVKGILDGAQPTLETVKGLINMDRLAFRLPEVEKTEESQKQYAAAVLRACEHAREHLP